MSVITARRPGVERAERAGIWSDRLLAALPFVTLYVWLCLLYAWESWGHVAPWNFSDELELAQLSRAIAETGHAARRGVPHSFNTLYAYVLAPVWWINDTESAYAAAKYVGVLVMTSVFFPAYGLARMVSPKWPALFAATAAASIPALYYSTMLVEEPLAYPWSTLCLFLIAKALLKRTRWWIAAAVGASLVAPLVRGELIVILAVFALGALGLVLVSERARRLRSDWTLGDWIGALALALGAVIVLNAFIAKHAYSWLISTEFYKGRMFSHGLWAAGALAIGLGIFPVVAGLAALAGTPGRKRTEAERVFVAVALAAIVGFGWYTAVKAAYISTVFSTLTVERNLIYVAPVLFAATALAFRSPPRLWALAASAGFALYLILTTDYKLDVRLYGDAPGFSILQGANLVYGWTAERAQNVLLGMLVLSVLALVLPRVLPGGEPARRILYTVVALGIIAWTVTGQISAASGSNEIADQAVEGIQRPLDWIDEQTGGEPTLYLGQKITDPSGIWQLEFWNRSLKHVWSTDGTAPGPGPTLTPDLIKPTGEITQPPSDVRFVVAEPGISIVGQREWRQHRRVGESVVDWNLIRIAQPLRLKRSVTGLYDDGWAGPDSQYARFTTPGDRAGYAVVTVSRKAWGGKDKPADVTMRVGHLRLGHDKQPALGKVTDTCSWVVHRLAARTFYLRAPPPPFLVRVTIDPTFTPHELDPRFSDVRQLGAVVDFAYARSVPPRARAC